MKKIIYYFFIFSFYYLIFSSLIFFFSFFSMLNQKVYKFEPINSLQKSIYFRSGYRNIWQNKKECVKFDQDFLYVPKIGKCNFKNIEFDTTLTFDENSRVTEYKSNNDEGVAILGDSLAMGWGVNDDQTYSAILEKKMQKKFFNQGVSSYGTIRQVKRFKNSKIEKKIETIIVHYNINDYIENKELDIKKLYNISNSKNLFEKEQTNITWFLKQWKRSFRLIFNEFKILLLNKDKELLVVDLNTHFSEVEKILLDNLKLKDKRVVIFFIVEPHMKIIDNLKKSDQLNFEHVILELDKSNFFLIDDHLNTFGHQSVATKLSEILKFKKNN